MTIADLQISRCRSCQAPIYWLRNDTTGRPAPIDVGLAEDGPIIIAAESGQLRYHVLTKAELVGGSPTIGRHTNHFQTCPAAAKHKKAAR